MVDQVALLSRLNKVEADMRAMLRLDELSLPTDTQEKESAQGPTEVKSIRSPEHVSNESCMLLINKFKQELQKERNKRLKVENTVIRLRASLVKMAQNIIDVNVSKRMALGVARQLRKQNEGNQNCLSKFLSTKHENDMLRRQLLEEKTKQQNLELQLTEVERNIRDRSPPNIPRPETVYARKNEQVASSEEQIYHDCQSEPILYEPKVWCNVSTQIINDQKELLKHNKPNSVTRRISSVSLQERRIAKNTSKCLSAKNVRSDLKSKININSIEKPQFFKYEEICKAVNHESWRKPLVKASSEIFHKVNEKYGGRYIYDWLRENISFPLTAKYFQNPWVQYLHDHSCSETEKKLDRKLHLLEIESSRKSDERRLQYSEIAMKLLEYKKSAEISIEELQKVRSHCAELQKQLDDYKKTVDEKLHSEILYRNRELETKMEECKKASKQFQMQILEAESRYKDLAKELETLKQESDVSCLQKEKENPDVLKQLHIEFKKLEEEYTAFKNEMETRASEKDKLISAMVIRERTLVEERENLKQAIEQLQHQSNNHLNKIKEMSTTLSEQEEIITEQKEIMNDKKIEIEEVAQSLEMSRTENRNNREHLSFLKYQLYVTTNALNKLKVVSKDMELEDIQLLKQELEQTRQQLTSKSSMVNFDEKQRIQEQAICKMLERELEEHKKRLSALTEEMKYYKEENEVLKGNHEKLHASKVLVEKKLEMFRSKCRKWAQWQQEINNQQKALNNQIQILKSQRENAVNDSKRIQQKLLKAVNKMSDK